MFKKLAKSIITRNFSTKGQNDKILKDFLDTRFLQFQNGEKAPMLFSNQEYDRRLSNLR